MRKSPACTTLLAVCLASAACLPAQDHFPSSEDLRHVRSLAQPHLSPDGKSVLIQVSDSTADGGKSHLWLVDIRNNTSRQLTWSPASDKRGEYAAEWMPDGSAILFLAHRGEHTQLFQLPMQGGESHPFDIKILPPVDESKSPGALPPATKPAPAPAPSEPIECDAEHFFIAPDGHHIAVLIKDPQTPGEKKQHDEKADAVFVDHDPHASRLYLLDPASGHITPTAVPPDVQRVSWTQRGDRLLAISQGMNNAGDIAPAASAWLLSVSVPEHPSRIAALPATLSTGAWSPDTTSFYFLAQSQADAPPGYEDLYQLMLASHSVRDLSAGFRGTIGHEDPIPADGRVYESVELGTHSTVFQFDGARQQPLQFATPTVSQLSTNAARSGWVWLGASSTQPPTLYYAAKLGDAGQALKTPDLIPAPWTPVPSRLITWQNDGLTIEGLLYLPPQASEHKVPLIVDVHGGPTGAWEDSWLPITQFLLGQGWAILRANPRGSTGYGAAFAAANKNDLGGGDYRDIMAGVDAAIARFPIDSSKLALFGYSYGGEMAGFVEGRTDRFKAIVSGAPVADQESEYGTEDSSWYDRWFYNGHPWEHAADAWRQSPLSGAAHAKTPFLLLQGQSDKTDPPGQSLEMYRALRQMGVPVELVEYPREDHGPLAMGIFGLPSPEPWHGFDARQRMITFIRKAFGE